MPDRPLKVLVLATFDGTNANVIRDYLFSFRAHSRHDYYYVFDCRVLDRETDFSPFDVILIFWSVYLLGPDLSEEVRDKIRGAPALKALFLQDEYRDVRPINRIMSHLGIQVMLTCVAEKDHETFYPRSLIPSLEATYSVLPGYVPAYLEHLPINGTSPRPLDIGYRSRAVPYYLGDLGREKAIIAERFQVISMEDGFRSDISVCEHDRLYGKRWLDFLKACRCVLGSASGASVVDFTGEIRRNCERYLGLNPTATYEEVKRRFFADVDWEVIIDTVSPRMFESAAFRCTQVLHEGGYAGILRPDEHYICVRRDYSNIDDVIDRMRDARFCRQLAERSHTDLIGSGSYSYRAFAKRFDTLLANHVGRPVRSGAVSALNFYARNYLWHDQAIIPYRDRFVMLPSRKLLHELLRAILSVLRRRRWGPLMSRLIENPGNFFVKGYVAWRVGLTVRPFRKILSCYLLHREARGQFRLHEAINDLLKFDIVRQARAGTLRARQPFRVSTDFDPEGGVLTLTSRPVDDEDEKKGGDSLPRALPDALRDGRVKLIVWDHSALGLQIVYATSRCKWLTVGLGSGGVHRFEALSELARSFPEQTCPALLSVLRGAASSAQVVP